MHHRLCTPRLHKLETTEDPTGVIRGAGRTHALHTQRNMQTLYGMRVAVRPLGGCFDLRKPSSAAFSAADSHGDRVSEDDVEGLPE